MLAQIKIGGLMKDNIILIGFMGSGKSLIGRLLADKLSYRFMDMDEKIEEQENCSISEIFTKSGEAFFRELETNFLKQLKLNSKTVLATGGGIILKEENVKQLKALGTVLFLHADFNHIIKNLKEDTTRPLLMGDDKEMTIKRLLDEREGIYLSSADVIIQTSGKTPDHIINEILSLL